MAKIYIAGPMSGLPNFNRDAFNAEAHRLLGLGHVALNPAILPDGLEQHEYMAICSEMVKMADQLVMLPGWERSKGARIEHDLARGLGFWVMEANAFLPMASAGTACTMGASRDVPRSPALVHRDTQQPMEVGS